MGGGGVCLAHTSVFVSSFHATRDCVHTQREMCVFLAEAKMSSWPRRN